MNESLPPQVESLLDHYSRETRARGEAYFKAGMVRISSTSKWDRSIQIKGGVRGSRSQPYDVLIVISLSSKEASVASSACSCPVSYFCKHGVATILQANSENPSLFSTVGGHTAPKSNISSAKKIQETPTTKSFATPTQEVISPALRKWLEEEEREQEFISSVHEEKHLFLELDIKKNQNVSVPTYHLYSAISIEPSFKIHTRWQKIGPYDIATLAQLKDPETVPLFQKLIVARTLQNNVENFNRGLVDIHEILVIAANLGRLLPPNQKNKRIGVGEPKTAKAVWITDSLGNLTPGFEFEMKQLQFLHLPRPLYWNRETFEIGAVDCGMNPIELQKWLSAPQIRLHEVSKVAEKMVEKHPTLPPPKEVKVVVVENPTKEAYIYLRPSKRYDLPEGIAEVIFQYDSERVSPQVSGSSIHKSTQEGIIRITRDLAWEKKKLQELKNAQLFDLSETLEKSSKATIFGPDYDAIMDEDEDYGWEDDWEEVEDEEESDEEFWRNFLENGVPKLQKLGWTTQVDSQFPYRKIEIESWYSDLSTEGKGGEWFSLDLGIQVEGEKIPLIPILMRWLRSFDNASEAKDYLKKRMEETISMELEDGRKILLPTERVRTMCHLFVEIFDQESSGRMLRLNKFSAAMAFDSLGDWDLSWKPLKSLEVIRDSIRGALKPKGVGKISGLKAELRPYQQEGIGWLKSLSTGSLGGILADDMGLGKTIQTLAWICGEMKEKKGPVLVVAPKSLMANWMAEAERFTPHLKVHLSHGKERIRAEDPLKKADLILTTYALLLQDEELLQKIEFHAIFLDEAQTIKNSKSKYFEKACGLKGKNRFCLTGTPLENHLGELWSLFQFINPGYLGGEKQFKTLFRNPIEKESDNFCLESLKRRIQPFMLRRTKDLVAKELPPKTEQIQRVTLESDQRDLYETLRIMMDKRIRDEIKKKGFARSQITILDALLKLRQCCCDPRLLKVDAAKKVKSSAKMEHLFELIPEMVEEGRRILLFSQFTTMLQLIENRLIDEKIPYLKLTGETENRGELVKKFQTAKIPVFLLSLKAGGSGLNLTAADTVIHYDPWWNPAVENQATDRAHRIGQEKPVFIHKLISEGTVEEKILKLQKKKRALAGGILEGKGLEKEQFSEKDLAFLLAPIGEIVKKSD